MIATTSSTTSSDSKEDKEIIGDYKLFLDLLFQGIKGLGINVDGLELDHLCYRVSLEEYYDVKKNEILSSGHEMLTEVNYNGRRISSFKLTQPILYEYQSNNGTSETKVIPLLELPSHKPSKPQLDGLEHFYFVTSQSFQDIKHQHDQAVKASNGRFTWVEIDIANKFNPNIELEMELSKDEKIALNTPKEVIDNRRSISVKFHPKSLQDMIDEEKKKEVEK
ncbi:hypothetical protein DFA_10771 [Cavenderia fasciculata]|uniref:Dihydroxybiphenyl dioxygenase domain-containing protein n=1 Tax=Cavenderia fasciculata TaxID=261658 RepID=F4QBC6_CACFS|nr:uncharacterized protein DFA_10771 [Cavenderia fasciculata]EGG14898.1 hypothetical protein DFA_10771 [Cavenderia fasciculata]|eukprot:XP_004351414.1 hypothetical protein DFA_10771 [Cavenderia fasciculata]